MHPHTTITRRRLQIAAIACAALASAGMSKAQNFPDKPIKIVVGAPAGGSADMMARVIGQEISSQLGQPVIVDNKPGAAGMIGMQEVLKAPRDGYTLMVGVNGIASEIPHVMKVPADPLKELRPLVDMGRTGLVLVGSPQLPASDFKSLIAYVKANPGKINYASYSTGTVSHTIGLEVNKQFGVDMQHVGYRGSPPALLDVMGNTVSLMFDGPATSIPLIKTNKLKVFATSSPTRLGALPNVPTFAELGYKDLTESMWMGMWVANGVPPAVQTKLREVTLKALQLPKVREQLSQLGMEAGSGASPEELLKSLQAASERQAATLKSINFKPE